MELIGLRGVAVDVQKCGKEWSFGVLDEATSAAYIDLVPVGGDVERETAMGARENKAAVRCLIEQCVNRNRLDLLGDIVADDVVIYPSTPNSYVDGVGLNEFRGVLATLQHVFTALQLRIDDLIADGDRVSVRWTATGIHSSEWLGFRPTFTPVTVGGMDLYEFLDGKIQRWWRIADLYGLVDQLERADSNERVVQWAD